jgi:dGTP triphosphohydrolase
VADATPEQRVVDYLAGMTDRFAVRAFSGLSVPQGF